MTPLANIHARKGALLSVEAGANFIRVAACSGPGHVAVVTGRHHVMLAPGKELLIANHTPTDSQRNPHDGVGRRNSHTYDVGQNLTIVTSEFSLVSFLTNAHHMQALRTPNCAISKRVAHRLVKTVAVVQHLTQSKGGYTASPNTKNSQQIPTLTPVRFNSGSGANKLLKAGL